MADPDPNATPLIIIDDRTKRVLSTRTEDVQAIIVHTTGGGATWKQILDFYTSSNGYQPHYAIELDGTVHQIAEETQVALHVGLHAREIELYQQGWEVWSHWRWNSKATPETAIDTGAEWGGYHTWRDMWRPAGLDSPLDLATGAHPNNVAIGIELQQPPDGQVGPDIFTDSQYQYLVLLVRDILTRHPLPLDRKSVLGHYDCSPMRRSTVRGGWDPGDAFNWDRLFNGVNPTPPAP